MEAQEWDEWMGVSLFGDTGRVIVILPVPI
jgi:hypothetical protein